MFLEEPEEYRQILQEQLKRGKSFPEARAFTAGKLLFDSKPETAVEFLKEPNHILGLEYIKALRRRNSSIQPITVKRKGNHYHEKILAEEYSSATSIRRELYQYYSRNKENKIFSNKNNEKMFVNREYPVDKENYVPKKYEESAFVNALCGEYSPFIEGFLQGNFITWEDMMPYLEYTFLLKNRVIGKYFGMNLDLARRFQNIFEPGLSFETLIERLHSKAAYGCRIKESTFAYRTPYKILIL